MLHLFITFRPDLLQRALRRLLRTAAAIQASLPPGTSLSSLLLLLLIPTMHAAVCPYLSVIDTRSLP